MSMSPLPVRVITPHSGLDGFRVAIASLTGGFGQARALAWRFFLKDTRADHRQSALGYVWLLIPPLINALTWIFLNNQRIITIHTGGVPYPVFVLTGTILWNAFNTSIVGTLGVISGARAFIGKVNFPQESLLYAAFLKSVVDAAIAAVILLPVIVIFHLEWRAAMLLFPLALLACILLGAALGLFALPVAALYSDVSRGIHLLLRFGFFLTPVIFPLPSRGASRQFMLANPVTAVIVTGRGWLTGSGEALPGAFALVLAISLFFCSVGLVFYKVILPHLVERMSS